MSVQVEPEKRKKRKPKAEPPRDPYCARAEKYARAIVAGDIAASKVTVACCARFLRDLESQKNPAWPYRFDEFLGGRACEFLEELPHVEGPLAGELLKLGDWQCFVQANVWGWVRKADGCRRFSRVEEWIPRGNGKSFFVSGNCTYATGATGEGGAQVASAATTREQAKIVLDVSRRQLELAPELAEKLGLEVSKHAIYQHATFSRYRALSSEAKTADGKNLYFVSCDELHAHPDRGLYDILLTGLGKRKEGTMYVISTAGDNHSGIGYERYSLAKKIAFGIVDDDQTFVAIWEADEDDPWDDERTWAKANPNLNVSVDINQLRQEAATAKTIASARSSFFTRRLNWWVGASQAFINLTHWDRCVDRSFSREALRADGVPLWVGLDLASKKDITCIAFVWRKMVEGEPHYWIAVDSYLPESAVDESGNASYRGWVADGFITVNDDDEIDYRVIMKKLQDAHAEYTIQQLAYDNYQPAAVVAQEAKAWLGDDLVVEVRGHYLHMNGPMRELEAALAGGRIHLEPNPCLRWMASNLIGKSRGDEVRPEKEHDANKIDGPVAILMALNRCAGSEMAPYSDGEGLREL